MATTKKTSTKKTVAKKTPATKSEAVKKAPAAKKSSAKTPAAKPAARKAAPKNGGNGADLSYDIIAERAYQLWESSGYMGSEVEHWLEAERQLRG